MTSAVGAQNPVHCRTRGETTNSITVMPRTVMMFCVNQEVPRIMKQNTRSQLNNPKPVSSSQARSFHGNWHVFVPIYCMGYSTDWNETGMRLPCVGRDGKLLRA